MKAFLFFYARGTVYSVYYLMQYNNPGTVAEASNALVNGGRGGELKRLIKVIGLIRLIRLTGLKRVTRLKNREVCSLHPTSQIIHHKYEHTPNCTTAPKP